MNGGYVRKRAVEGDARTRKRGATKITKIAVKPRPADNGTSMKQRLARLGELARGLPRPPATKAAPPAESDAIDATGALGLRAAFGLSTDAARCERTAKEASAHRKAATKAEGSQTGHEGRAVDVPAAVRPQILAKPLPNVVEYDATGQRIDPTAGAMSAILVLVTEAYVANGRRSITLDVGELSRQSGLSPDQVHSAIAGLEARRLLLRDPGRAGSLPRFAPAVAA